jgi:hypothetical protein
VAAEYFIVFTNDTQPYGAEQTFIGRTIKESGGQATLEQIEAAYKKRFYIRPDHLLMDDAMVEEGGHRQIAYPYEPTTKLVSAR